MQGRLTVRSDREFEQIAYAELLIPETPNVFGDYWTKEGVAEAAIEFARGGYGMDVDHDHIDVSGEVTVVEMFIAASDDKVFTPGSFVVGVHFSDYNTWQKVISGEINGFSYEGMVSQIPATLVVEDDGVRQGVTEPYPLDGHTHEYAVFVDENGRPVAGGTTETDGHSHTISTHTVTDESAGHVHRFNMAMRAA